MWMTSRFLVRFLYQAIAVVQIFEERMTSSAWAEAAIFLPVQRCKGLRKYLGLDAVVASIAEVHQSLIMLVNKPLRCV